MKNSFPSSKVYQFENKSYISHQWQRQASVIGKKRKIRNVQITLWPEQSLSKVEYAAIDNDINLPNFYHTLFLSSDFVTIGGIIENLKEADFKLLKIRHANAYIEALSNKYALGDALLSSFLGELHSEKEEKLKKQIRRLKRKETKHTFARRW